MLTTAAKKRKSKSSASLGRKGNATQARFWYIQDGTKLKLLQQVHVGKRLLIKVADLYKRKVIFPKETRHNFSNIPLQRSMMTAQPPP